MDHLATVYRNGTGVPADAATANKYEVAPLLFHRVRVWSDSLLAACSDGRSVQRLPEGKEGDTGCVRDRANLAQ